MRFVGLDQPRSWFIPIRGRSRNFEKVGSAKVVRKMGPEKVSRKMGVGKKGPEKEAGKGGRKKGARKRYLGSKKTLFECFSYKMFPKLLLKGGAGLGDPFGPLFYIYPSWYLFTPGCPWKEKELYTGNKNLCHFKIFKKILWSMPK